jgi:YidC/Oxa1 family membrane protein insertase
VVLGLFLALLALAVVACGTAATSSTPNSSPAVASVSSGSPAPGANAVASPHPSATATPQPLKAAEPSDLWGLINWAFTPIFQVLFIILADFYALTGNVLIAIIFLTILIRLLTFRLSARQLVSQKRVQMLAPELAILKKDLDKRYKGDRQALLTAQQEFYKERGVSPTAGCLPSILQMGMLIPMYSVIRIGLTNFDPSAMFTVFGLKVVPITCPNPAHITNQVVDKALPCINTVVAGVDMGKEQVLFNLPILGFTLGVSILAIIAAFLQLIQSRMMLPPAIENDPSASTQRSMMIMMPLFSVLYGGLLPAGLFIYWIATSLFSIVQQFLIVGWGSMFPIFGWEPGFARNYTPRFPVTMPTVADSGKSVAATRYKPEERRASAASTVRPNTHRRASRRGRRR